MTAIAFCVHRRKIQLDPNDRMRSGKKKKEEEEGDYIARHRKGARYPKWSGSSSIETERAVRQPPTRGHDIWKAHHGKASSFIFFSFTVYVYTTMQYKMCAGKNHFDCLAKKKKKRCSAIFNHLSRNRTTERKRNTVRLDVRIILSAPYSFWCNSRIENDVATRLLDASHRWTFFI